MLFPEISDRKYDREFVRLLSYSLCYNESTAGGNTPEKKIYVKKGVFTMKNMNIPRSQLIKFLIFIPVFFLFNLGMSWIACQFLDTVNFSEVLRPGNLISMLPGCAAFGWFLFLRRSKRTQSA